MRVNGFRWGAGVLAVALIAAAGLVAACGSNTPPPPATTGAEAAPAPRVPPAISINAMMVALVDHSAHAIWDAAATPPATDHDWQQLEYHAMQTAAAGTLIATGGTGPADPGWVQLPAWREWSQQLTDDGVAAIAAVREKDVATLSTIGDRLLETCEACHKEFKPDVPTEGLVHEPLYEH